MKGSAYVKLSTEANTAYVDIFSNYGVSFVKGSYLTLIKKAGSKGYATNDSSLSHGVQVVASATFAKYASRNLSVTILLEASSKSDYVTKIENFTDKISQGLFCLKIPSVKRVFKLVYTDMKVKQEYRGNRAIFTLDLMEPNCEDRITLT